MSVSTLASEEEALVAFVATLPEDAALAARTLAHAWTGGGGRLAVGKVSVRLLAGDGYTAGAIHRDARLEFCRVILEKHGLDHDRWVHWSDACADLGARGFDPEARFPSIALDDVGAAELARLATAVRDLAQSVQ